MAVFIVLWSCLFTTKLSSLQKNKPGHTKVLNMYIEGHGKVSMLYHFLCKYVPCFALSRNSCFKVKASLPAGSVNKKD